MVPDGYAVYKVKYKLDVKDPHMPSDRAHHAIFVQSARDAGTLHHATGEITPRGGMSYEKKEVRDPRRSPSFVSRKLLGYTRMNTHPLMWETVLKSLPTPPQQKAANVAREGRVEPFKRRIGDNHFVFYGKGEDHKPLWKCTEWIEWHAILALQKNHLIQNK